MEGKVIQGRYLDSELKKNNRDGSLYIETNDGRIIRLTEKKVLFIDDVTTSYPEYGDRILMIMWDDTETSLIRVNENKPMSNTNVNTPKKGSFEKETTKSERVADLLSRLPELIIQIISWAFIIVVLSAMLRSCDFSTKGDDGAYIDWGPGYYWDSSSHSVERNIFSD